MSDRLSVIIPTLNEEKHLGATLASIRREIPTAEIIVVDGGSTDRTGDLAQAERVDRWIVAERGRGRQCARGAREASGAWFLFLHADTRLGEGAGGAIAVFSRRPGAAVANFRLRFAQASFFLKLSAFWTRFDTVCTRFGDQGILIRREVYLSLGGFPDWPLFEDVELLRRARRLGRVPSLLPAVVTSARRFHTTGQMKRQLANGILLTRFLLGASPERLAAHYEKGVPRHSSSTSSVRQTIV